ncbi:(2Fe-2S) ferredoxin domain-containing protein [Pseudonocardia sp.]|uniref:(2Fe-2S) ferredoxin domain-containing protein n=1 Tax=Pseudonocardia sp. TaxID=60912 RepID=UPI00261E02BA|nr:(2Fe-2S) ferredoxin domain-containing protein [Pseudonocardia sp.]
MAAPTLPGPAPHAGPSTRWVVLVARPTPAGVDRRSADALAAAVRAGLDGPVVVGYLDQADPSVHAVLDDARAAGAGEVVLVPLAVPADAYLTTWIARAVANWRETRGDDLDVRIGDGLTAAPALAGAVAALVEQGEPVTASPAAYRSPAWSVIPEHARHVLVCRGPRCTAFGAGATHRGLSRAARGTDALVTPTGCLGPCNLGPLVVVQPDGVWHERVDEGGAERVVRGG